MRRSRKTGSLVIVGTGIALGQMTVEARECIKAARNIVARANGRPLEPFRYRERGVVVALGVGRGAGVLSRVTIWGSPARLLKRVVEKEYSRSAERGEPSRLL